MTTDTREARPASAEVAKTLLTAKISTIQRLIAVNITS